MKCGFHHFTLIDVTADFFYKLSNTSDATTIRENERVPAINPLINVQSVSPVFSVMCLVGQNEKSVNLDTDFLTVMEGSFKRPISNKV
jgi:hypothetical protein